jgi:hypothetical protein
MTMHGSSLFLRIGSRGVADHALVFGELLVQHERIVSLDARPEVATTTKVDLSNNLHGPMH